MPFGFDKKVHTEPGPEVAIFEKYLRAQGLKLTSARLDVLNLVFADHSHFTADELHDRCRRQGLRVSKATLYRTLAILLDCKLLAAHDFGQDAKYYEHIFGHRHHDHMYCECCRRIFEFRSESIEELQDKAALEAGFHSQRHSLTIFGVCADCAATREGQALLRVKEQDDIS